MYFAMLILALSQMICFLAVQLPYTGGEDSIQGGTSRDAIQLCCHHARSSLTVLSSSESNA